MSDDLLPGEDLHSRARYLLADMPDHLRDQLKAQAAEEGRTLLDLCAEFVGRCERGEP